VNDPIRNVPLGQPTVGDEELQAVAEVFASGWLSGAGPACAALEKEFAEATGAEHALTTTNCGSALHLALQVLGAGPGDEVIVSDYTFPATSHAVVWAGATPVFADVRPDTGNIDTDSLAALVTPRTVGIIAVDLVGQPADFLQLRELADKAGLWLVEDAACSSGATYMGRPAGSIGADLAAFSFHGRKGITAGEGGALVGNDSDLMERARRLHTYGIAPALTREASSQLAIPQFEEIGHNYRMSEVQAAIMRVQLRRLPDLIAARTRAAEFYNRELSGINGISVPVVAPDRTHSWQSYLIEIDDPLDRDAVAIELRARGVGCNFGTYAAHLQPVYQAKQSCPISAGLFSRHLAIPMHANLANEDLEYVVDVIRTVAANMKS
jgi:perosamine synthetase